MKAKQAILILSGYNIRALIAFCRWASARGIAFHIVASSGDDPILLTKYKNCVAFVRSSSDLRAEYVAEWVEHLFREHAYNRILVLPSSEYLNRFLLSKKGELESAGCCVPLVDEGLYLRLSNKHSFAALCSSYGLGVPLELGSLPSAPPFVAKPRNYLSRTGRKLIPHLVNTRQDLERFLREEDGEDFFYQEYVPGRSLYLLACLRDNGNDVLFSQENLMQQARGGSIILARRSDFHETPTARQYISMLRTLKFKGLIMIEVRHDESSGRHCMIEANPRLWGPMQLAVDNGIDLFGAFLSDQGMNMGSSDSPPPPADKFYFWSGGLHPQAHPVCFHHYSSEQFVRDLPSLWRHDLFLRQDTLDLHRHELGTNPLREY